MKTGARHPFMWNRPALYSMQREMDALATLRQNISYGKP
jgi:hypothetical protein